MKSSLKALLRGLGWVFMMIGGLAFWFAGRLISELAKIDRILGEMLGLGLAGGCLAIGFILKSAGESDEIQEGQNSS